MVSGKFEIESLSIRYPGQSRDLLQDINIELDSGELLLIKGPNGCGKTSLLNAISGVIPQKIAAELDGTVSLNGVILNQIPLCERFHWLCYQMCDPDRQLFFPTPDQEIAFGMENLGIPTPDMQLRLAAAKQSFGISDWEGIAPQHLSHGQKKLLLFAVCAILETPLILLDEPVEGLAESALLRLRNWLEECKAQGKIILIAEHSPALNDLSTRCLDLSR